MYAIAFDLDFNTTQALHPESVRQAYRHVEAVFARYGFRRVQQSVFLTSEPDLAAITHVMAALKAMPWFPRCVKDVRAFRVDDWSDFTSFIKSNR